MATVSRRSAPVEQPKLRAKRCIVAIYENGTLHRVVYQSEPLRRAQLFCRRYNSLNRMTPFVAAFHPLACAANRKGVRA